LRNTRVIDIVRELGEYNTQVDVYDPWISSSEAETEYGVLPVDEPVKGGYDAIIIAVGHQQFKAMGMESIRKLGKPDGHLVYDLKYLFPSDQSDIRL
jgi:UDP-N-acetyl-D-galactosamine dehydrogenase